MSSSPIRLMTWEVSPSKPDKHGHWILIEREFHDKDLAIGPYADAEQAEKAMLDSLLVEGFVQEDCVDCYTIEGVPEPDYEWVVVDLNDPDHLGQPPKIERGETPK